MKNYFPIKGIIDRQKSSSTAFLKSGTTATVVLIEDGYLGKTMFYMDIYFYGGAT